MRKIIHELKEDALLTEIVDKIMDDHENTIYWDTGDLELLRENIKKGIIYYHEHKNQQKNL